MDELQDNLIKRSDFNEHMRKNVYGPEILKEFDNFNTEKAVVWIDPLDGTSDFVKGNLSAVTVLIGLVIDGVPKIGVVHHPFKTNDNDGQGLTLYGTQEHGAYQLDFHKDMTPDQLNGRTSNYIQPFDIHEKISEEYNMRVATSLWRLSDDMKATIDQLSPVEIK